MAHAVYVQPGFDGLPGGDRTGAEEQAQGGHLDRVAIAFEGHAETFDHALQATHGRKELACELEDFHRDSTRERKAGRRAIQLRKRRRRRRGSSQMARKMT